MNRKEWMQSEIAAWQTEGVIGKDLATQLLGRYVEAKTRISWGAMLAGTFGALLIGLGIIALFAANWDFLGRGARAAILLTPVIICGSIAVHAARQEWQTRSFWEPLGILWTIATVAATCLVAQTYQVSGSVPGLILFVAILTLPIVWVTRSVVVMAFWPIFAFLWGGTMASETYRSWSVVFKALGLLMLSVPAFVTFQRHELGKVTRAIGQWMTGFVYALGTSIMMTSVMPLVDYSIRGEVDVGIWWGCSVVVWLAGAFFRISPWKFVATLVASCAAMMTVFQATWIYIVAIGLAVVIAAYGVFKMLLSYTNVGTILCLWLVLGKFFESKISFTVKGLVLIGAGVALTVLNVAMIKFKKNRKMGNGK